MFTPCFCYYLGDTQRIPLNLCAVMPVPGQKKKVQIQGNTEQTGQNNSDSLLDPSTSTGTGCCCAHSLELKSWKYAFIRASNLSEMLVKFVRRDQVFRSVYIIKVIVLSLMLVSTIFPRLLTSFFVTRGIESLSKRKWYISFTIPFLETRKLYLANWNVIFAHIIASLGVWGDIASQRASALHYPCPKKHHQVKCKKCHLYGTTSDEPVKRQGMCIDKV